MVLSATFIPLLLAFFFYEYTITFSSEVEYFWKLRPTGPSILYLSSRYLSLAVQLMSFAILAFRFTDTVRCLRRHAPFIQS